MSIGSMKVPRPLILAGSWLLMLAVAFLFIYIIENAVISQIPWMSEHSH